MTNTSTDYDATPEAGSIPMGIKSAYDDMDLDAKDSGVVHVENRDPK